MTNLESKRASAMVRKETIINTAVSAVIAVAVTWLSFRKESSIVPLGPPPTGIFGIFPGTISFLIFVTMALTLITRKRVKAGLYQRIAPMPDSLRWRIWPKSLILRAFLVALFGTLVFVPAGVLVAGIGVHTGMWPSPWSFAGVTGFFVGYFVLLSLVATPIIVWRALAD